MEPEFGLLPVSGEPKADWRHLRLKTCNRQATGAAFFKLPRTYNPKLGCIHRFWTAGLERGQKKRKSRWRYRKRAAGDDCEAEVLDPAVVGARRVRDGQDSIFAVVAGVFFVPVLPTTAA
jgi:hypothetical protein